MRFTRDRDATRHESFTLQDLLHHSNNIRMALETSDGVRDIGWR